jgi:hypothetical protein
MRKPETMKNEKLVIEKLEAQSAPGFCWGGGGAS